MLPPEVLRGKAEQQSLSPALHHQLVDRTRGSARRTPDPFAYENARVSFLAIVVVGKIQESITRKHSSGQTTQHPRSLARFPPPQELVARVAAARS